MNSTDGPAGVTFLDHTADLGMDVDAGSFAQLLHRAALGMLALLYGEEEEGQGSTTPDSSRGRSLRFDAVSAEVTGGGPSELLAAWLREILFFHEVRHLDYVRSELDVVGEYRIAGTILARPAGRAAREIKGVTYHELQAVQQPEGTWRARVIFDV